MKFTWVRVNKNEPCKVCGYKEWCTVCPELGLALCMRIESKRPSKNSMGGWLHSLDKNQAKQIKHAEKQPEAPTIDANKIMQSLLTDQKWNGMQQRLAESLGVSLNSLRVMGCAWAPQHRAWAFPMQDGEGRTIGIRLRDDSGHKWAVTGSRQGIFVPYSKPETIAFIVEGPTDCAAALTLGLFPIGRPSCRGSVAYTQVAINRLGIQQAVLVADNDLSKFNEKTQRWVPSPGLEGAKVLAKEIQVPCCRLILPSKDLREFLTLGGTKELIGSLIGSLVWHHPN